jgi:nitrogen fixation NifU-like protein
VNDLRELYQEVLLDHYRRPRNFGALDGASRKVEGHNPLCGDRITLYVDVDGERVKRLSFEGSGCAISTASASLLTEAVQGKTRAEVDALYHRFHGLVTDDASEGDPEVELGKLEIFSGVREYPMRVKCATLSWHALRSALEGGGTVSTE